MLKQPVAARIAVSGPDGYVSPDWYGIVDQVPTWNYVAVHLTGVLELRSQEEMRDLLDRQSAYYEDRLRPKPPWRTDKMTDEARWIADDADDCALPDAGRGHSGHLEAEPEQAR